MRRLYYSDDEFSQAFSELKNYREVPPTGNWREINARLDQRTAFRYTKLIGIAASLAVILSLGLGIYFSTEPARERTQAIKRQNAGKPTFVVEPKVTKAPTQETIAPAVSTEVTNPSAKVEQALANIESGIAVLEASREQDIIPPIKSIRRSAFGASRSASGYRAHQLLTDADFDLSGSDVVRGQIDEPHINPFYFGVNIQPHNTMLTGMADQSSKQFSPGMAYGVSAGYRLSDAWALETGGMLSMENQRYQTSVVRGGSTAASNARVSDEAIASEPVVQQNNLALNYYRIPLMVKFRMPWSQRRSIKDESVSMIGGVQYGYFRNGFNQSITDGQQVSSVVTEDIKRSDVQVLTGVERSSSISKNFAVSYGVKVGYGLRQISSLESERVTKFNSPHNMSAAFNLALMFSK